MKRFPTSFVIKEFWVKTMTYHYKSVRMAKTPKIIIPIAGEDAEQNEPSFISGGNAKW